jgi:hypothetical protein
VSNRFDLKDVPNLFATPVICDARNRSVLDRLHADAEIQRPISSRFQFTEYREKDIKLPAVDAAQILQDADDSAVWLQF